MNQEKLVKALKILSEYHALNDKSLAQSEHADNRQNTENELANLDAK